MDRAQAEAIAVAGGEPARLQVLGLLDRVGGLEERVAELERRSNRDSLNSSLAPSDDPPLTRQQRRALARERAKKNLKRTRGGQRGHEGTTRTIAAQADVQGVFDHLPEVCKGCGEPFTGGEERLGDPVVRQQWEVPVIAPLVFEHHFHRVCCAGCGKATLAPMRGGIAASAFGPRLHAHVAVMCGIWRLSRRQAASAVSGMLGVPICVGSIDAVIARMSVILADPWRELHHAVQQAQVKHADETCWPQAGTAQWLWVAVTSLMACFRVDPSRSQQAARALLGEDLGQSVISDRYVGYHYLDVLHQQFCWAHLIRQFTEIAQRPGPCGLYGEKLQAAAREVIGIYHAHLQAQGSLEDLQESLSEPRSRIHGVLEKLAKGTDKRGRNFATRLLGEYPALWTFCFVEGVDPTNNAAERAIRHAVLMRTVQLGTQSDRGSRWIERINTARETCRLQGRQIGDYLTAAATAACHGNAIPSLLPP